MSLWVTYPAKFVLLLWTQMPMFLISAIFWQMMFCAVIWTLEKQSKKKSWGHMCLSKRVIAVEGHVTESSSRKAWGLASGWGRVEDTENTLLCGNWNFHCPRGKVRILLQHLGRLSRRGQAVPSAQGSLPPSRPWPPQKPPSKFVMVSISATCGIRTTSWDCEVPPG